MNVPIMDLLQSVRDNSDYFTGDIKSGRAGVNGVIIEYSITASADALIAEITIVEKPFYIAYSFIESTIRETFNPNKRKF